MKYVMLIVDNFDWMDCLSRRSRSPQSNKCPHTILIFVKWVVNKFASIYDKIGIDPLHVGL